MSDPKSSEEPFKYICPRKAEVETEPSVATVVRCNDRYVRMIEYVGAPAPGVADVLNGVQNA